jgi:hypothetical protein
MADQIPKFEDTVEPTPSFDSTVPVAPSFEQTASAPVPAALVTPPQDPDYLRAAVKGATAIPRAIGRGIEHVVGQQNLEAAGLPTTKSSTLGDYIAPLDKRPMTTGEKIAEFAGGFADPVGLVTGVGAAKAVGPILKGASPLIRGAVTGGAAAGTTEAINAGANQVEEGQFKPGELAARVGIATGLGAGIGALASKLAKTEKIQQEVSDLAVKNTGATPDLTPPSPVVEQAAAKATASTGIKGAYETQAPTPTIFSAKDAQAAKKADQLISRTTTRLANAQSAAESEADPVLKALKFQEVDRLKGHLEQQNLRFKEALDTPAYKALKEAKDKIGDVTMSVNGRETPLFRQSLTKQGVYIPPSDIEALSAAKDIGKIQSSAVSSVDQLRLLQEADGNQINGPLRQMIFQPAEDAVLAAKNQANDLRNAFRQQVVDLGIDTSPERQKFLFQAAEKRLSPEAMQGLTENERTFIDNTKKMYSDLLDQINAKRAQLGYKVVAKRKDYVTHIGEWNVWDSLGLGADAPVGSDSISPFAKKLKASFNYEKARKGGPFKENLMDAFEAYIDPATRQLNTLETGALLHGRAKFLPPNLRKATTEWINSAVLGGIDAKDASIMNAGFEPALRIANKITGATSRGTILGNIKVITDQPSQMLETARQTGLMPMLRGHAQAFFNPPVELQRASSFLTLRNINDDLVQVPKSVLHKPTEWMKSILEFSDKYVARASWYAGYNKAQTMGLSQPAAIKYADDVARMLHGNYNALYKPAILRGKSGVTFAPLQNYAFNTWNHLVRDPKVVGELKNTSTLRQVLGTLGAMYATNQIYEGMGLQGPFGVDAPNELSPEGVMQATKNTALNMIPLVKSVSYGAPSPIMNQIKEEAKFALGADAPKSVLKHTMTAIFSDEEDARDKAKKELAKTGAVYAPFGLQAMKTIEGVKAARDGYYKVGHEEVDLTPQDKRLGLIFGPGATPSVRKARQGQELEKIARGLNRERN